MINHLLLKVSLTDGYTVAQDMLNILCPTATPTATITPTPTPTMTMTPTPTSRAPEVLSYYLNNTNDYMYTVGDNIVARFIITNNSYTNISIRLPVIDTSSPNILSTTDIIYNSVVIGQMQYDATRLGPSTAIDISFILSGNVLTYNGILLTSPRIVLI
jgi:hypothetical protein